MRLVEIVPGAEALGRLVFSFPRPKEGPGAQAKAATAAAGEPGEPQALLSLRPGGSMRYLEGVENSHRDGFFRQAGVDPARALGLTLTHSRRILIPADADDLARLAAAAASEGGADGLVLRDRALVAFITVADCMPIWILDRASGAFGVLHSGWKGTGILSTAVAELASSFGTKPSDISAIFGPAIGNCCYNVEEDRAASFRSEFGEGSAELRGGRWHIDLRVANLGLAARLGIGSVLSVKACTYCDSRFGSYRREGPGAFTRMVAACGLFPRQEAG